MCMGVKSNCSHNQIIFCCVYIALCSISQPFIQRGICLNTMASCLWERMYASLYKVINDEDNHRYYQHCCMDRQLGFTVMFCRLQYFYFIYLFLL